MAPVAQRLNDGVELPILVQIMPLNIIQLLAEILDRMSFLTKNTPNINARGFTSNLEYLARIWQEKNGCLSHEELESLKSILTWGSPFEGVGPDKIGDGRYDSAKRR